MTVPMADRDGWIWLDGEFVPWKEAKIHVLTHTFHYGMGAFEGVRAYETDQDQRTAIFRLQEHTDRLFNSAQILRIQHNLDKDQVNEIQKEVVRKNNLHSAYIRPMIFYGSESMGLHANELQVHFMVAAWDWGTYLGTENMQKGIRVKTSSFIRNHVNAAMCKAKANGNYINSMLAVQEAMDANCDEALMLNANGHVCEGSGENIFIVKDNQLLTPELSSVLDGITRRTIIQMASDLGYSVIERNITRDEVYVADEAFFTGTAAEVTPIRELDSRLIGDGKPGSITQQLQQLYFQVIHGKESRYKEWLTFL